MKKKNSVKRRHVVAWINKAEWDQVLEYLYSNDASLQKYALHRISAWKSRYANNSPVAVDCTADLVRCQVLDRSGQLDGDDLVLLYGTAMVRFVNLITERQQGKVARPLRRLAGKLNIPEWIVNLRHDFTHRKLPTLKWCRKGCKAVLEWLQQEYWSRQMGGGSNEEEAWESQLDRDDEEAYLKSQDDELIAKQKEVEAYKNARELLISFEREQYQGFDGVSEYKEKRCSPEPFAEMNWILAEIKQLAVDSSELLIDVLLEDGFLVPTVEQLETLGCDPCNNTSPSAPRLPQNFLRFWLPLLKMLNSPSFIHLLLEKLFVELKILFTEPNNHKAYYISAWISEIFVCNTKKFEYHFETKGQKKARIKSSIFVNRIQLRWQQLLSACLDAPCVSTPHLLKLILDDMEHPLPVETRERLLLLSSIYTQTTRPECDPTPQQKQQPIYTLDSLHEKLQHSRRWRSRADFERSESSHDYKWADAEAEKAKLLRGSPWQVCADKVLWKNYPLGKVPGQSDDPSCLMVDTYSTMTVFDQPVELESTAQHNVSGAPATVRTEGSLWNHSDVNKLKSGLQLF